MALDLKLRRGNLPADPACQQGRFISMLPRVCIVDYCSWIEQLERVNAPFGIVRLVGNYEAIAVPNAPTNHRQMHEPLADFRLLPTATPPAATASTGYAIA